MRKKALFLICTAILALVIMAGCSCDGGEKESFVVKFQSYIDQTVPAQRVEMDGLVACPSLNADRAGYTFIGWYYGEKRWDFEKDTVTKDITLTAKWQSYLSYAQAQDESDGLWVVGCDFDITKATIPSEYNGKRITGIHWGFTGRSKLTSVAIPSTVEYISENAFNGCAMLEEIIIPEGVTKIGEGAFSFCDNLKSIYCEASSMPVGWHQGFNKTKAVVEFGYKK